MQHYIKVARPATDKSGKPTGEYEDVQQISTHHVHNYRRRGFVVVTPETAAGRAEPKPSEAPKPKRGRPRKKATDDADG
mgnify:CR=1 FL=1